MTNPSNLTPEQRLDAMEKAWIKENPSSPGINAALDMGRGIMATRAIALDLLATNRAQAEEVEKLEAERNRLQKGNTELRDAMREAYRWLKKTEDDLSTVTHERDARTQEAAQAQARVKEVEKRLTHFATSCEMLAENLMARDLNGERLFGMDEWSTNVVCLRKLGESCAKMLAESSPTAALEAVVQRAREEVAEYAWGIVDHYCSTGKLGITREEAFQIRDVIRAAGLREGEKP